MTGPVPFTGLLVRRVACPASRSAQRRTISAVARWKIPKGCDAADRADGGLPRKPEITAATRSPSVARCRNCARGASKPGRDAAQLRTRHAPPEAPLPPRIDQPPRPSPRSTGSATVPACQGVVRSEAEVEARPRCRPRSRGGQSLPSSSYLCRPWLISQSQFWRDIQ